MNRHRSFSAVCRIPGIILIVFLASCASSRLHIPAGEDKALHRMIENNAVFSQHHTGFALYDPADRKWICRSKSDKLYTPASNVKILTMLTCLQVLGDSIESLRYGIHGDTLYFEGAADPTFLYWPVESSNTTFNLLRDFDGSVCYVPGLDIDHYGKGWAWDDYGYGWQVEKSLLPVYGNRVRFAIDENGLLTTIPGYFTDYVMENSGSEQESSRDAFTNTFSVNPDLLQAGDTIEVPFIVSDYDLARILEDTLGRPVCIDYEGLPRIMVNTIYGASRDSVLKEMMHESDNFIAEQLLMQCAKQMTGSFETDSAIDVAALMILGDDEHKMRWVDGSGLSRYNALSPEQIVHVLDQVLTLTSEQYVTSIFPAGGRDGTITDSFGGEVFAKSGSMSGMYCLSGFVRTKSGKLLIFSEMHNQIGASTSEVRQVMNQLLVSIARKY